MTQNGIDEQNVKYIFHKTYREKVNAKLLKNNN